MSRSIAQRIVEHGVRLGWASEVPWESDFIRSGDRVFCGESAMIFMRIEGQHAVLRLLDGSGRRRRVRIDRSPLAWVMHSHSGEDISLDVPFSPVRVRGGGRDGWRPLGTPTSTLGYSTR